MVERIKRAFPALLAALMMFLAACAPEVQEQAGAVPGVAITPGAENLAPGNAKGRYMENPFDLELPEGVNGLSVLSIIQVEGAMEIFSMNSDAWETENPTFYRHTLTSDGAQALQKEPWLNDHLRLGNEMQVVRGGDGALYAIYADYDADNNQHAHLIVSRDDGKTGQELTGGGIDPLEMITGLAVLSDGRIAAQGWNQSALTILDAEGGRLTDIETGRGAKADCGVAASGDRLAVLAPDGKAVRVYDMKADSYEDWPYEFDRTGAKIAFSPDGTLYLVDITGIYRHAQGGTLWECIVDGSTATIGLPQQYSSHIAVLGGEHDSIYIRAGLRGTDDILLRYAFDPEASQTISEQINVFSLHDRDVVRRAVVAFNRARSDVKVNYTVAMQMNGGGTEADYIKSLNTELLAGTGPDIILMDGLPVDSYIEKGVLADLAAIVDGADPILPNVRVAYETDGKLFCVPLGIGAPLSLSKGGSYQTLAELDANAAMLSKSAFTPNTLSAMLLSFYGEEFYSVPDEASAAELFAKAKRIAETLGVNAGSTEVLKNAWGVPSEMTLEEWFGEDMYTMQLGAYAANEAEAFLGEATGFNVDFMYTAGAMEQFGGELNALNGKMTPLGLVGLNSASQYADTSAQFIQTLLSEDVQNGGASQRGFSVNAAAMDAVLASVVEHLLVGFDFGEAGTVFQTSWPSAAAREKLGTIIKSLNAPLKSDMTLNAMIEPELIALFEGTETPESAAARLFSKLSAYRSE